MCQILLEREDFDEALNLLDQARLEEIPPDVLLYNTILQKACLKVMVFYLIWLLCSI